MSQLITKRKKYKALVLTGISLLILSACSSETNSVNTASSPMPVATLAMTAPVMQPAPGIDIDRSTAVGQVLDDQGRLGWYPHEGGLMEYSVDIRFGMEPNSMPEGWYFGRVSAVATDSNNDVYVFQRDSGS